MYMFTFSSKTKEFLKLLKLIYVIFLALKISSNLRKAHVISVF